MHEVGLRLLLIGFESGSDRILKFLRKGSPRPHNREAARICSEIGVKVWANYMLGLPTETKEEVMETLSMLEEIRPYHCSPASYTPHPGNDLYKLGQETGIHLTTTHDSYRRNPSEPEIDGPDYEFVKDVLYQSISLAEPDGNPVLPQQE